MKLKYLLLACFLMTGRVMAEADLSEQWCSGTQGLGVTKQNVHLAQLLKTTV